MKLLIALCLLVFFSCVAAAQEPATTPPTEAGLIQVNVTVTDPSDRLVVGFEKDAFQLWEDGVEQKIVSMSLGKELNEYVLSYKPTNTATDGSWRKLKVGLVSAVFGRLTIRSKQGYYGPTADKN